MQIELHQHSQDNQAEILVVGLSRHPENSKGWDDFAKRFDGKLESWTKQDLSYDLKSVITYPTLSGAIPRVLFIGLNDRKKLTEEDLRSCFGLVGKELAKKKLNTQRFIWSHLKTTRLAVKMLLI
ncbi:Cytosol aminopeptidase PepA [Planococcus halocryophilus Or1]|nr:Cytosol aminopeptidase PepA [Planococcus halocryophilus Or1]